MRPYDVDFFDRDWSFVHHTAVDSVEFSEDYLSPETNELTILYSPLPALYQYILIRRNSEEYFGIVTAVTESKESLLQISYKPFLSLFDERIMYDTDDQGTGTLEAALAGIIRDTWINNSDTVQNIPGLTVTTSSSTSRWGFNLKSDKENMHHTAVNFLKVFIIQALSKYRVRIKVTPDPQAKTITLDIGKVSTSVRYIEADLPNVISRNIVIKKTDDKVNKLTVYNTEDYSQTRTYYLHTDGSYSRTNTDRIIPVVREIAQTAPERSGDTIKKSFAVMADAEAADCFAIEYDNLIELEVMHGDTLIQPELIEIGQVVAVISEGKAYNSMLTGRQVEDTTLLIFGSIRLDLTKRI